jgi:dTDP-glucose pyrophosphorylase
MLETIFLSLRPAGVVDVCLVVNHLADQIETFAGDGRRWQLNISYVYQERPLGTADAVRCAAEFITETCYILAADYALPPNFLSDLQRAYQGQSCPLFASLKELSTAELAQKSSVRFHQDGRIAEIVEKPPPGLAPSSIGASPFLIVPVEIGRYLTDLTRSSRGEYEIMDVINRMIQDGHPMSGLLQPQPPEWKLSNIA